MPFEKFIEINDAEQIKYDDINFLTKDGLSVFHRLYGNNEKTDSEYEQVLGKIMPKIKQELDLYLKVISDRHKYKKIDAISEIFDVFNRGSFKRHLVNSKRISSVSQFAEIAADYINSGQAKKDGYYIYDTPYIEPDEISESIELGIIHAAEIYSSESEWLLRDSVLNIPNGSQLIFKIGDYENIVDKYNELIDKYKLRERYKISFVSVVNVESFSTKKRIEEEEYFNKKLNVGRESVNKKTSNILLGIENDIINEIEYKVVDNFKQRVGDSVIKDDEGNEIGTSPFDVKEFSEFYNSLMYDFIDSYEKNIPEVVSRKDKWTFNGNLYEIINSIKKKIKEKRDSQHEDLYIMDGRRISDYDFYQSMYDAFYDIDTAVYADKIKPKIGADLYRYYAKDEVSFKQGGEVDTKQTYAKWKGLVNMSKSELKEFYDSKEGKEAGLKASEAKAQGIDSGRESARWIYKMKSTPVSEWTPAMWKWANKQISFISRMKGVKGKLYDDKGNKTRKHTALLIWGHNPEKYNVGGGVEDNPTLRDVEVKKSVSPMNGDIKFTFKLGDANAIILDYGEPMGVEGMPSWAKKEHYVENLWRDKQNEKSKGFGLNVILKILQNAKENGADIVTGKMREDRGNKLHEYYKSLGFKDIGNEEPDGVYIDLRTNKPIEYIEKIIADKSESLLSKEQSLPTQLKVGGGVGGNVEKLIERGVVDLEFYNTTSEHASLYGFKSTNPLYVKRIFVNENYRNKGIGSDVLQYLHEYAKENNHDLIFGHIEQKSEPSIGVIKSLLKKNGYSTIKGNNDFYKYIDANISKKYIMQNKSLFANGYFFDMRRLLNMIDPYGQVPLNLDFTLISYNSGGQNNLNLIDTINATILADKLCQLCDLSKSQSYVVVNYFIDNAERLINIKQIKTEKIVIVDRDNIVCENIKYADGGITNFKFKNKNNETRKSGTKGKASFSKSQAAPKEVRYNGTDAITSRGRSQSDKDDARWIAKEKVKDDATNLSLKSANKYNKSISESYGRKYLLY
jgi:GNAT superfamily N-acetyltransferase/dihydrofolate reductase